MICRACGNTRSYVAASISWDKFYLDADGTVFDVKNLDVSDLLPDDDDPEFRTECGDCGSTDIDWEDD